MKKKISLLLCLVVSFFLTACPKNSKLAQSKPKKNPSKQEAKTALNPERINEKLSEELAEMRERREAHERYDQPREAAEFYKLKRVPVGETEIPVEKYLQAKEQMREMRQYSSAENRFLPSRAEMERSPQREANVEALGNWTPLGPGNIGGRTRALIIHPTSTNVMYAGGVAGGVWKTINGGTNWTPVGDLLPNIAVSALVFDPANPEIIFAGTGEGYYNADGLRGAGIFKSVNAGISWTRIASTDTPDFYFVNDIIVSHNNSNNIYVATKTGIMRSVNGGGAWENVLLASGGLGCTDLVIRKDKTTDYLFAASSNGSGSAAKIFRNDNASTAAGIWSNVYSESGMDRAAIAISPSNQNVVYAVASTSLRGDYQYGLQAVWRSNSSGDSGTWTAQVRNSDTVKLNTLLFTNPLAATYAECNFAPNRFYSQGDYDMAIAVDPTDENRVWVGGIDLFRSDDGGRNWGLASYWWAEPTDPSYSHADNHIIVFHPNFNGTTNKKMFVGSDGGISQTDDARANVAVGSQATCSPANTAVRWTSLNNNFGVTQFYHGAVFPDGKSYFGGAQDNGTLLGNDTAGVNGWKEIFGGDGGYVAIDPTNPNILFSSTPGGNFRKSTDGGKTWGDATFGVNDTSLFIAPLAIDPSDPQRMWTGGRLLWMTNNGGANWVGARMSVAGSVSAVAVAPTDSNFVVVGSTSGNIQYSENALSATDWITSGSRSGFVSSIAIDPTNKKIVYASYSTFGGSHVWKSINGGNSWAAIDGSGTSALPDIPVSSITVDPINPARVFVGTDLGVFVTMDNGASWAIENTGFANAPVESLVNNTANGVSSLYAFTHGRGVWRATLGAKNCSFSLSRFSQNFAVTGGTGSVNISNSTNCSWNALSNVSWITINNGSSSNGNGTVNFSVTPNDTLLTRFGTISVADKNFTITQAGKIDRQAPVIQITAPSTNGTFQVSESTVTITGTVLDTGKITTMRWENNRGLSDQIYPNGNQWTASVFNLKTGVNLITIIAYDESGNIGSSSIKINLISDQVINAYAGTGVSGSSGDGGPALSATMLPYDVTVDNQGNLYISDIVACRIRKVSPQGIITTVAGNGTCASSGDGGMAVNSQLASPFGIGTDTQGNLYLVEALTASIRKITVSSGIISTVVSKQQGNWLTPNDVAVDKNGNLYVSDSGLHQVKKVTSAGVVSIFAGGNGGFGGDGGQATAAFLNAPMSIAVDGQGNVIFNDSGNGKIRRVTTNGIINSLASSGRIASVGADSVGNIFFTIPRQLSKIKLDGTVVVVVPDSTFSAPPPGDGGAPISARITDAYGVAVDNLGSIYVVSDNRVRKISTINVTDTLAPSVAILSPAANSTTINPILTMSGTASDNINVTHVSWENDRGGKGIATGNTNWGILEIQLRSGSNIITVKAWDQVGNSSTKTLSINFNPANALSPLVGTGDQGFLESGSSLASQLYAPETVAVDNAGNIFIADKGNHRIRKVTRSGVISTVAGNGQIGSSGDGGLAINAPFNSPNGVVVDNSGNIYIADTNNHRIRKVNSAGIISTIAGSGIQGFAGDGSANPALQQFDIPVGIFLDTTGNLLVADAGNHRIRKLNLTTGVLTTIAGKGYGSGTPDGTAAINSFLRYPTSVVADAAGNIFISNTSGNNIKKINSAGILTNFAGNGTAGFGGDGDDAKLAQFNGPGGIALDAAGNLYVTDQANNCLRKIDTSGVISTPAGRGTNNNLKDPIIAPSEAGFNAPAGVVVDRAGNIIVADTNNHRVVVIAAFKNAVSVNGASFQATPVAAESIASVFGNNLTIGTQIATTLPLPTELSGTTVKVRDSLGNERLAPLFYAGAGQVNYQIPAGTAAGFATIIITNSNGEISTGAVNVTTIQPGVFSATSDGAGAAAATLLFIKNGVRTGGIVAPCTAQGCNAVPIDLNAYDETYVEMYGTGIRANSGLSNVTATIGGVNVPLLYAGAHCCFVGVDQLNLLLPKSLVGKGLVDVVLTVDGKVANAVKINVK
jgi:uncharacterized protein (TIGR03437 family)